MVLKFSFPNPPLKKKAFQSLNSFPFKLPKTYLNILKEHDGGSLRYDFEYYDHEFSKTLSGGIGVLFGLENGYKITEEYSNPPEFLPKNLVPFGENGGGDFVCFDYRHDSTTNNPPIVYALHEYVDSKNVSYLAKDFEEFLSLLKEPEEGED